MKSDGAVDTWLVGTWHYGKKTSQYTITLTESGGLRFDGPFKQETVSGILKYSLSSWQADLFLKNGQRAGSIRLRIDTVLETLVSNFRAVRQGADWGKDIVARREGSPHLPLTSPKNEAKPSGHEIDPTEPLVLIGECNQWNVAKAVRQFHFTLVKSADGVSQNRLCVEIDSDDFPFQILSARQTWDWRLYPRRVQVLTPGDQTKILASWLYGHDHSAANHRNFSISNQKGKTVDVFVEIKSDAQFVWCTLAKGRAPQHQQATRQADHKSFLVSTIRPLHLVGEFCRWRSEREGLAFSTTSSLTNGREEHQLCVQMCSAEFSFQVVSRPMGYRWRLFPDGSESICLRELHHFQCRLGGEEDGHKLHFTIREPLFNVIVISVRVDTCGPEGAEQISGCSIWYTRRAASQPHVGIGRNHIEYPPRKKSVLESAHLDAAQTDEERNAILKKRLELVQQICWRIQQEYSQESVQREVLALRLYYPYYTKKSFLALEFDMSSSKRFAIAGASSDGVQTNALRDPDNMTSVSPSSLASQKSQMRYVSEQESISEVPIALPMVDLPQAMLPIPKNSRHGLAPHIKAEESPDSHSASDLERLKLDLETRLMLTQEKIRNLEMQLDNGLEGVKEVLLQQVRNEERAFTIAVKDVKRYSSADDAWLEVLEKFNRSMFGTSVLGDADAQWRQAVHKLPSVVAARIKAQTALGVSDAEVSLALALSGELREQDAKVFESSVLLEKRLRYMATPHPNLAQEIAKALKKDGAWIGSPQQWFHLLEVSIHTDWTFVSVDFDVAWKDGLFKYWFGGPRSGRYCIFSENELFDRKLFRLSATVTLLKDYLTSLIDIMGDDGNCLQVESRAMLTFHNKNDSLAPWIDNAKQGRHLTFVFNFSLGQSKPNEGGAFKLCPHRRSQKNFHKSFEMPAAGGHWCIFFNREFKQEISQVKLPCGRWSIMVFVERMTSLSPNPKATMLRSTPQNTNGARDYTVYDGFHEICLTCDCCGFAAGDGVLMACSYDHRVCRGCAQNEIRKSLVPTCPACLKDDDPVCTAAGWDFFASDSIEDIGCVCSRDTVDPGAIVIIAGQRKESQLNGKLAEAVWWSMETGLWEVRVFATGQLVSIGKNQLHPVDSCSSGGSLSKCPCWPLGRGVFPISIGCRCCVKQGIMDCTACNDVPQGYPYWHGSEYFPFDWNLTSLDGILFFLRHDFANFFHYNYVKTVKAVNNDYITFQNYTSSLMSFLHHCPVKDRGKLSHRMERWRLLCNHSREVRAARTVVFIRYLHDSSEFARIDELYSLLRLWAGGRIRLCIVCMLQTADDSPRLYRHARFSRVLMYLVGHIGVLDMEPVRRICRFAAYDEAGLLTCETIEIAKLPLKRFRDPYTTQSGLCKEGDWLDPLPDGEDYAFFPDCPACRLPWQGSQKNALLAQAVKSGACARVEELVWFHTQLCTTTTYSDPNSWDEDGRRPLHHAVSLTPSTCPTVAVVRIVALLLLSRADPRCYDKKRITVLEHAHLVNAPKEISALLGTAALIEMPVDAAALYDALEMVGEPLRSRLATMLDVGGLRVVGPAEFAWRNPPPDSDSFINEVEEALGHLEKLPELQRKKEMKRLLLEWHPDKNMHRHDLATAVFQYLQASKDRIIKR